MKVFTQLFLGLGFIFFFLLAGSWLFGFDLALDRYIATNLAESAESSLLHDEQLHIVFCGTGPLSTDADRMGSCIAIVAAGETFIFDTGAGSVRELANTEVSLGSISTVFFTHFHSDHFSDFGELMVASRLMGRTHPLTVFGPAGVDSVVRGFTDAFAIDHSFREAQHGELLPKQAAIAYSHQVDLSDFTERVELLARNGVSISAFLVNHAPVSPALGYRIEYKGRVVVISGDTAKHEALVAHARGADILIHEAMDKVFARRIIRVAHEQGFTRMAILIDDALVNHSSEIDAAQIAQLAGVDTLILTHISPPLESVMLRYRFVRSAEKYFDGNVILADDGLHYSMQPRQ